MPRVRPLLRRTTLSRSAPYLVIGVLAGALGGGAWVSAHGGDGGQVHACVKPDDAAAGRPNTIIVQPDQSCPSGYQAMDWNAQGPPGPQGATGAAAPVPDALSPHPRPFVEIAEQFGLRAQLKYVTRKTSSESSYSSLKEATSPPCPAKYALFTGGYETSGLSPSVSEEAEFKVFFNGPVGFGAQKRWKAAVGLAGSIFYANPWKLTAYVVCKKK